MKTGHKLLLLLCGVTLVALTPDARVFADPPRPSVVGVSTTRPTTLLQAGAKPPKAEVELGYPVWLSISNFCAVDQAKLKDSILYLNGLPILDAHPVIVDREVDAIRFDLKRTEVSSSTWDSILGRPVIGTRSIELSMGYVGGERWPGTATADIVVLPLLRFAVSAIFVAVLLLIFLVYLVPYTNIVRDAGSNPGPFTLKTYSLSRCQMALWFFVILGSYLLIYSTTWNTSISISALVLMGLSFGTGAAGKMVDTVKARSAKSEADTLTTERISILSRISPLNAAHKQLPTSAQTTLEAATARLAQIQNRLNELTQTIAPSASQSAIPDLFTDDGGASLHRFQMAAWTVVVVAIFLHSVYVELSMPELSPALLGLMGISNGIYIAMKTTE